VLASTTQSPSGLMRSGVAASHGHTVLIIRSRLWMRPYLPSAYPAMNSSRSFPCRVYLLPRKSSCPLRFRYNARNDVSLPDAMSASWVALRTCLRASFHASSSSDDGPNTYFCSVTTITTYLCLVFQNNDFTPSTSSGGVLF